MFSLALYFSLLGSLSSRLFRDNLGPCQGRLTGNLEGRHSTYKGVVGEPMIFMLRIWDPLPESVGISGVGSGFRV